MARITVFEPGRQQVTPHLSRVPCFYQVVPASGGDLLHLSTFGSADRQSPPKSSQSIQLDREGALALVEIIKKTFPDEVV